MNASIIQLKENCKLSSLSLGADNYTETFEGFKKRHKIIFTANFLKHSTFSLTIISHVTT